MENFRVAVKAFIINDGKILLIKRRPNDVHKPERWDIPGGRLEIGENPFDGMRRETAEEVGIDIEIIAPVDIHHFTRDDGQKITMIIFLCKPQDKTIKLSEEHTEYAWEDVDSVSSLISWLADTASKYKTYFEGRV